MKVRIYSDGGCYKNGCEEHSVGGYGTIVVIDGREHCFEGAENPSTNNRMEMLSALRGLEEMEGLIGDVKPKIKGFIRPLTVRVTTDSKYLVNGITKWINGWVKRGWRTAGGDLVKNEELWRRLHHFDQKYHIDWQWVKGHDGHEYNERCDEMATGQILQLRSELGGSECHA